MMKNRSQESEVRIQNEEAETVFLLTSGFWLLTSAADGVNRE